MKKVKLILTVIAVISLVVFIVGCVRPEEKPPETPGSPTEPGTIETHPNSYYETSVDELFEKEFSDLGEDTEDLDELEALIA